MNNLEQRFTEKANAFSAVVSTIGSISEAFKYAVDICEKKEKCQLLISGCTESLSDKGKNLCELKEWGKMIVAPSLTDDQYKEFAKVAKDKNISLLKDDMRKNLAGIDVGFTFADFGIAETGTLIINSTSEELRLATMISEIHVAVLPKSKLVERQEDISDQMEKWFKNGPSFIAGITGASRTADIERVLAIGVHGPLELHILMLEDK